MNRNSLIVAFLVLRLVVFAQWNLAITSRVEKEGKGLGGAKIELFQGAKLVSEMSSSSNGEFKIEVPANGDYLIQVSYQNCNPKKFQVFTRGVPPDVAADDFNPKYKIGGFTMKEPLYSIDYSALKNPMVKIVYFPETGKFDHVDAHTEQMLKALDKIREAERILLEKQAEAVKAGDAALKDNDCVLAKTNYEKAISIIPQVPYEEYPKAQLIKCANCLKEKDEGGKKAAAEAAALIAAEKAAAEKLAKEKAAADQAKVQREKAEKEQAAKAKQESERVAKEKEAADKLAKEKAESDKKAAEALAKAQEEKQAKEKAEAERIAKEKEKADKLAKEKAEADKKALAESSKAEQEKLAKEKSEKEKAEKERLEKEKETTERLTKEKETADKLAREQKESEQKAADERAKAEQEKLSKERSLAVDNSAKEKAEAERVAKEKAEAEEKKLAERKKKEAEKAEKEKSNREAKEKEEAERLAKEKEKKEKPKVTEPEKKEAEPEKVFVETKKEDKSGEKSVIIPKESPVSEGKTRDIGSSKAKRSTPVVLGADQYKQSIEKADDYYRMKRYDEAKIAYEEALSYKANDTYAKSRLEQIAKLNQAK